MSAQLSKSSSPPRAPEEARGVGLTTAGDSEDALSAEGAYYLEHVTITEISEDDYEYEEIPDDNFSIPEGEEDLAKTTQIVQEQTTDSQILEQETVLPSRHAVPEVIEDFLCNFLIKMGMTRTLDCFQSEWYELIQKGVNENRAVQNVPDVYSQVMALENENKHLKKDLKLFKRAADKAREDLLETQKERDFHRMHHKRVVQEKNKLINDLKGLRLHYASYEPTIRVLHEKHHTLLREKMLASLERDRVVEKPVAVAYGAAALFAPASAVCLASICNSSAVADLPGKVLSSPVSNMRDSEFPLVMQPNSDLNLCKKNLRPIKLDYKLNNIFRLHELPVSCLNLHPCEDFLVSCSEDRLWKVVGLPQGNVLLTGHGHTDWLSDCCFDPSGNLLATSSGDATVKLWDLCKGDCVLTFEGHKHAIWSCTWHSCGHSVASASLDTTSKIWDVSSEKCRGTLYGHRDSVNSIEFFPLSNTLLTASADKTLSIWDARTIRCEQSLYGHMHSINDATFSPKGHIIASCDACGVIKLWDFRKLLPIVSIDEGPSPGNEVNFDSSGRILAQASSSGLIHLLDLKSGQIHKLMGHDSKVNTVVFSHDDESLFSGGSDGAIRMWF
ncbi:sperm-associated antigen 16 protein [Ctenodactylus gundi]